MDDHDHSELQSLLDDFTRRKNTMDVKEMPFVMSTIASHPLVVLKDVNEVKERLRWEVIRKHRMQLEFMQNEHDFSTPITIRGSTMNMMILEELLKLKGYRVDRDDVFSKSILTITLM